MDCLDPEKQVLIDRVMQLLAEMEETPGPLELTDWVTVGVMSYRRSVLPPEHEESWPSRWKAHFGEEMPFAKYLEAGLPEPWAIEFWSDVSEHEADHHWSRHAQLYESSEVALEQLRKDRQMNHLTGEQFKGKVFRVRNLATEQMVML